MPPEYCRTSLSAHVRQVHEFQGLRDPAGPLGARHSVELRGNQQVFVAGQVAVRGKHLRNVADFLAHEPRDACTRSKPAIFAVPSVGGSSVVSILMSVLFPAPFGPSKSEGRARRDGKCQMVDGDKRAVPPRQGENFNDIRAGAGFHGR